MRLALATLSLIPALIAASPALAAPRQAARPNAEQAVAALGNPLVQEVAARPPPARPARRCRGGRHVARSGAARRSAL